MALLPAGRSAALRDSQAPGLRARIGHCRVAEDVRVAPDHLVDDGGDDVPEPEASGLFAHSCVEDDLEEQISQLVDQRGVVSPRNRVRHFVRFLDGVRNNGVEGLFQVPGATPFRVPQSGHHGVAARRSCLIGAFRKSSLRGNGNSSRDAPGVGAALRPGRKAAFPTRARAPGHRRVDAPRCMLTFDPAWTISVPPARGEIPGKQYSFGIGAHLIPGPGQPES